MLCDYEAEDLITGHDIGFCFALPLAGFAHVSRYQDRRPLTVKTKREHGFMSYAYCTAGIAACSAGRPRAKQAPEHRDRLSPARSASPRRKVARPIAYTSDMGDGVTGAKGRRRDEHEIGDRGPSTFMVVSQDEEQGVCL
jgi:hypothetical protein